MYFTNPQRWNPKKPVILHRSTKLGGR